MDNKQNDLSAEELIRKLMANLGSDDDDNQRKDAMEQITIDNLKSSEEEGDDGYYDGSEDYEPEAPVGMIYHFKVKSRRAKAEEQAADEDEPSFSVPFVQDDLSSGDEEAQEEGEDAPADEELFEEEEDDISRSIHNAEKYVSDLEERVATGDISGESLPIDDEDDEDEDEQSGEDGEATSDTFGELADLASIAVTTDSDGEYYEEEAAPAEPEENIDDLDENDINLMMIFNRDEELREKLGDDEVERIMRSMEDDRDMQVTDRDKEYTSHDQNAEFSGDYHKKFIRNTIRLIGSILFFLFVLIVELMYMSGKRPIAKGDDLLYVLIAMQITLICGALGYKEFIGGFRSLFSGRADPNTVFSVGTFFTFVYEIAVIAQSDKIGMYNMFNIPLAISSVLCIIGSRLDLRREMRSFKIISTRKPKFAIAHLASADTTLEKETFDSYLDESEESDILGVSRAEFIQKFSARSSRIGANKSIIGMLIPIPVIAAVIFFAIGYFGDTSGATGLVKGLSAAESVIMMALPFSIFIGYAFPFWCASKSAYKIGSAIIGEGSLEEYSKASVVTFNDRDVFPAKGVKVRSMHLYGTNRIDHVLYRTASVFAKLGGPLSDVFTHATKDLGYSEDVDIVEIGDGGVEAAVDGERVVVGSADYLKVNGYSPAVEEDDREAEYSGQLSIMYVVIGEEIAAKMYIEYRMDPEFGEVMKTLCRSGVCLGIRTFDPNLNNAMLDRRIKLSKYPVRILRCAQGTEMSRVEPELDSGIVSKKSPKHLLKTLTLCDRVLQVTKTNVAIKIISIVLAIIIVALVTFFGDITKLSSIWVLLYQMFWMIPMIVISILFI